MDFSECPFRIHLILSTLSGKPLKLKKIRSQDEEPGLTEYEVDLLKLIDLITNGTRVDISETGTSLYYVPGMLTGGTHRHQCKLSRSIGYYLEVLVCLVPFMKQPLEITLMGVTNDQLDPSIDLFKYSTLPVLKKFLGSDDGLELKILKRGAKPDGGGEIFFRCPTKMKLVPINFVDPGKIKRIRGIAYAMRVSPSICNRLVETAKGILIKLLPDVYIVSDHLKGVNAGNSPGFGLTLVAETINGSFLCAEAYSLPKGSMSDGNIPEDIATEATYRLLEEIYRGGCVDSNNQYLAFLFMALNQKDVSKCLTGILSPYSIKFLRHMRQYFDVMFKIEPFNRNENHFKAIDTVTSKKSIINLTTDEIKQLEEEEKLKEKAKKEANELLKLGHDKLILSCLGLGYTNLTKTFI